MAILKTAQLGHPILRRTALEVPRDAVRTRLIQSLISDMIATMREYDGVGLAAPQVHESRRIVVIASHRNPRYPKAPAVPLTVFINPRVTTLPGPRITWWEGCLSIPSIRGRVTRASRVRVRALDRLGRPFARIYEGFSAVVVQHECDHLQGFLYIDRMKDLRALAYEREYRVHWAPAEAKAAGEGADS